MTFRIEPHEMHLLTMLLIKNSNPRLDVGYGSIKSLHRIYLERNNKSEEHLFITTGTTLNDCYDRWIYGRYDDDVFAQGSNVYCALANSASDKPVLNTLEKIPKLSCKGIMELDSGATHILAQTWEGKVLAWGHNQQGQLGVGDTSNRLYPVIVKLPSSVKVSSFAAGTNHSVAAGHTNKEGQVLYVWGSNKIGQLGKISLTKSASSPSPGGLPHPPGTANTENVLLPVKMDLHLPEDEIVQRVYASEITLLQTNKGKLWSCGIKSDGGTVTSSKPAPIRIDLKGEKVQECCTVKFMGAARTEEGNLWIWSSTDSTDPKPRKIIKHPAISKLIPTRGNRILAQDKNGGLHEISDEENGDNLVKLQEDSLWESLLNAGPINLNIIKVKPPHRPYASSGHFLDESPAYDDPLYHDIEFEVPTKASGSDVEFKIIKAHKFILATRVEVFDRQFRGDWADNMRPKPGDDSPPRIRIEDYTYPVFSCLLKFIYTGNIEAKELTLEELVQLFNAAKYYMVMSRRRFGSSVPLSQICSQIIQERLSKRDYQCEELVESYLLARPHDELSGLFTGMLVSKLTPRNFIDVAKVAHRTNMSLLMKAVARYFIWKRSELSPLLKDEKDSDFKAHLFEMMLELD